jgi:sugar/nucleoside kinase (ribokinase family)
MKQYDLVAIGRAFTDIVAKVDAGFLKRYDLVKGQGTELSPHELIFLRSELSSYEILPGGAPSNTAAGVAALGGRAAFFGKVCNDIAGRAFRKVFVDDGIAFPNADMPSGPDALSATCLILVTPDNEATMAYCRGVADHLVRGDIDADIIRSAKLLLIQSHLLLSEQSRDAVEYALQLAPEAGCEIVLSLHDLHLSASGRKLFLDQYYPKAGIVIGNKGEVRELFGDADPVQFKESPTLHVMTDGAKGAWISGRGELVHVPAVNVLMMPNTVGAGDQFAAGFLYGYAHNLSYERAARLGSEAAAAIMQSQGTRPKGSWEGIAARYILRTAILPEEDFRKQNG